MNSDARRLAILAVLGCSLVVGLAQGAGGAEASLELPVDEVAPGQEFQVRFEAPAGLPSNAWVGIVPSDIPHGSEATNDQHDLSYQYLGGKTSGTLTFQAPSQPGNYDLRLHDTDSNGLEIASVSFVVVPPDYSGAALELTATEYVAGEAIRVRFTAPEGLPTNAWVGIVPSEIPHGDEATNDSHDIAYRYLQGATSGTLEFNAPARSGAFDFRMHNTDSGGIELASVSFNVEAEVDAAAMRRQLEDSGRIALYGVRFATDSATLTPESRQTLGQVGRLLEESPELRLRVEGHTDDQGAEAYNLRLSERRAEAVKTYLVENLGIDPSRLTTQGFGESRPIGDNEKEEGRAQNRRVELARQEAR